MFTSPENLMAPNSRKIQRYLFDHPNFQESLNQYLFFSCHVIQLLEARLNRESFLD